MSQDNPFRKIPAVDLIIESKNLKEDLAQTRREIVKRLIQNQIQALKTALKSKQNTEVPSADELALLVHQELKKLTSPVLVPVVNATGIILHTNLGRALLTKSAQEAVTKASQSYCNLEVDLSTGKRTRRDLNLEPLLKALTGCEAATVVNNTSAAVFLALRTLAEGKEVITSRGELVEIGGSYRVPDVVKASGCKLVEVGTTNRTKLSDYENAITPNTALILKTHTSNYRVVGFTEEVELEKLVSLSHSKNIPILVDLGSGYYLPESGQKLQEPDIVSVLNSGADLVCFSGDKLLSGPQSGIMIGNQKTIDAIRKNALWRALRIDKLTVAALGASLSEHFQSKPRVPEKTMSELLCPSLDEQKQLGEKLCRDLKNIRPTWEFQLTLGKAYFGGGSMPEQATDAYQIQIKSQNQSADQLEKSFRKTPPHIMGVLLGGEFYINLATLISGDEHTLIEKVKAGLA